MVSQLCSRVLAAAGYEAGEHRPARRLARWLIADIEAPAYPIAHIWIRLMHRSPREDQNTPGLHWYWHRILEAD